MRAVVCNAYGPPESLTVEEVASPVAGPGEVVITTRAASLNFPDVLIIQNKYQFKPPLPFSPGSEVAGTIKKVGPDVKGVTPGDRVMAFTMYGGYAESVNIYVSSVIWLTAVSDYVRDAAVGVTFDITDF